jgi:uncharacterized protein with HEPN domain
VRDDRERLRDILEAIDRINKYLPPEPERFAEDELLQVWVVHHIQILGEACSSLSTEFVRQHAEIPWPQIVEMRNILVHEYFRVDLNIVWSVAHNDLPSLKKQILAILAAVP